MSQIIKKRFRYSELLLSSLFILSIFTAPQSCITRSEGCLDIAAANFDFNADRSCEDCCTYPLLSVTLSQKWNERNFSSDSLLTDIHGTPYRMLDLKYFLSSWSWKDQASNQYTIDSALIACPDHLVSYTPDIIIVDSKQFDYSLGTIHVSPILKTLSFKLGLSTALHCIDEADPAIPVVLSDNSLLWDSIHQTRGDVRIVLQRDTAMDVLDTLYLNVSDNIQIDYEGQFITGKAARLMVTVNYAKWFEQLDLTDLSSVKTGIISGVTGSFFQTP